MLVLSSAVGFQAGATEPGTSPPTHDYHIWNLHTHPWFWEVLFSALVGWVLSIRKGYKGTADLYAKHFPNAPNWVIFVSDLLFLVVVGAYFGTGIYNPANFVAAIAAGLNWPVGVNALLGRTGAR